MDFSFNFGRGSDISRKRIPLKEALRLYWKHLVPITLLPTVFIVVLGLLPNVWAFWAVVPLFYWSTYYASIPWTKRDAPYSFLVVGGVLWLFGAFPGALVSGAIHALLDS